MAQSNPLSVAQMTAVLDNAPGGGLCQRVRILGIAVCEPIGQKNTLQGRRHSRHHMLPGGGI